MVAINTTPMAIFPDYPREQPAIDKSGNFTPLWDLGFNALFQALQANYKNEGLVLPPLTTAQMASIEGLYTPYVDQNPPISYGILTDNQPDISGQVVYDSATQIANQFTIAQDGSGNVTLAEWVPFAMMLTNAGDPNGAQAGILNWLCLDTTGHTLYVCTTAGTKDGNGGTTQAVWTSL